MKGSKKSTKTGLAGVDIPCDGRAVSVGVAGLAVDDNGGAGGVQDDGQGHQDDRCHHHVRVFCSDCIELLIVC